MQVDQHRLHDRDVTGRHRDLVGVLGHRRTHKLLGTLSTADEHDLNARVTEPSAQARKRLAPAEGTQNNPPMRHHRMVSHA